MEKKDFLMTVELIMMFGQNLNIPIDRARWVLSGTQQRTGGTPCEMNAFKENSNLLPTSSTLFCSISLSDGAKIQFSQQ